MTKYEQILDLDEHHKVPVSNAYRNGSQCGIFIDYMADDLAQLTAKKIANANFLSVLWDGTLDVTVKEKESLFAMFLNKQAEGKRVRVETEFLGLKAVEHAHAQ